MSHSEGWRSPHWAAEDDSTTPRRFLLWGSGPRGALAILWAQGSGSPLCLLQAAGLQDYVGVLNSSQLHRTGSTKEWATEKAGILGWLGHLMLAPPGFCILLRHLGVTEI